MCLPPSATPSFPPHRDFENDFFFFIFTPERILWNFGYVDRSIDLTKGTNPIEDMSLFIDHYTKLRVPVEVFIRLIISLQQR